MDEYYLNFYENVIRFKIIWLIFLVCLCMCIHIYIFVYIYIYMRIYVQWLYTSIYIGVDILEREIECFGVRYDFQCWPCYLNSLNPICKITKVILVCSITILNNKTVPLHENAQEMLLLPLISYLIKIKNCRFKKIVWTNFFGYCCCCF